MASSSSQYLLTELKGRIQSFGSRMNWYRRRHYVVKLSLGFFSAIIAVLSGWKGSQLSADTTSNIVLALSALSTVVALWGSILSPEDSWRLYAESYSRLRELQSRLEFDVAIKGEQLPDPQSYFDRYEHVL